MNNWNFVSAQSPDQCLRIYGDDLQQLVIVALAALAVREETGPYSPDNCRILALSLSEEKAFDRALKVRTDPGIPAPDGVPLKRLTDKQFEDYAKEFMEEAKRRNLPAPRRSFSFE